MHNGKSLGNLRTLKMHRVNISLYASGKSLFLELLKSIANGRLPVHHFTEHF